MAFRALTGPLVRVAMLGSLAVAGCGSGDALTGSDAGSNASTSPACSPSTDYLRCDSNNTVAHCVCTKNGSQEGIDVTGAPIYKCLSNNWVEDTVCSVTCDATVAPSTGCLASTVPIPECAQDGITCWNGNLTFCENGYPLPTTPCAAGTQCTLVPGCQALCLSPSATLDPRCPDLPGLSNDFCAENVAYHCACGYLIGTMECADTASCVTVSSYDSYDHVSGPSAQCGLLP